VWGGVGVGRVAVGLAVGRRCGPVRVDRGAELGAQARKLLERAGTMGLELVDLAAPAQALLDGLGGLGRGVLAGAARVVVGLGADLLGVSVAGVTDLLRVGLGPGAQLGAVLLGLAVELLRLLLGGQQDVRGESHEDWLELGRDLIARGLGAPLLIVADGAPGLLKAIEQCWPASDRQHCCVHRVRNLLAKLPERERERVRAAYWQALDDAVDERDGKQRLQALIGELDQAGYTAAAKCLADDLDALVVHLRYPTRHRRRWRSTNLLEPSLAEVKRRTKVIGRFPGETTCLTLVWAVLDLYITHAKNGVRFNQLDRQRLKNIRYHGADDATPEEVTAA
jgi:hypothetical protein